ncbi:uncharacterized protein LOC120635611 isoform X2 [Pararge aegeria]|uniref:uncharacterized protein LOC120635611 isoform X2 n=1 Tax=Pararge aegeria TaxID=116150 RepID=UPI0019D28F63|nr:uncharacterized protein LOC120635611 isoform X2 [Pararge aegeria]
MVQTCYICKWRADREPRRSFHKFPFVEAEKQKWLDVIGKSNVSLGKRTSVCSIHFERSCFRYGLVNGRELLRQGSVPTLQLTRPPEVDPYEDLYNMHQVHDIEIKIEPEDWEVSGYGEAEMNTDVPNTDQVPASQESLMKTETDVQNSDVTKKVIAIEVPQAPNIKTTAARNKQNSVKPVKMDFSNRKEFLKKQSLVRMLVERLRRDHVKLKNYIQTLEERQKTVKRRRKKKIEVTVE